VTDLKSTTRRKKLKGKIQRKNGKGLRVALPVPVNMKKAPGP